MEHFQELGEGHEHARADQWHEMVQRQKQQQGPVRLCLETSGGPAFVDLCIRPFEATLPNENRPRVFALCSTAPPECTAQVMQMVEKLGFEAMLFSMDGRHIVGGQPETVAENFSLPDMLKNFFWESNCVEEFMSKLLNMSEPISVEKRRRSSTLEAADDVGEKERWSLLKFSVMKDCGRNVGIFVTQMDITELKKAQRDLVRLNQHQNELVAQFTHDLRTPLHGITGLSEAILSRRDISKEVEKPLKIIKSQANRLSALVSDIVDAAANRRQSLLIRHAMVKLREVCQSAVDTVSPLVNRNVDIQVEIPEHVPEIEGDSSRLLQVLVNLLANSVRFTAKGHIRVAAAVKDESVILSVSDTGVGIPEGRIKSIFGVFERGDNDTTRKFGGSGLGLALVKTLVEAHTGSIDVTSRTHPDDHGTTFRAILPIKQPPSQPSQQPNTAKSRADSSEGEEGSTADRKSVV